ncbi:MAG: restriction endonuclease subunit S [Verrucomicrobia bacterium]|nr:restriction endonuclease subunit S [Verrucomicrobiota bacterium]
MNTGIFGAVPDDWTVKKLGFLVSLQSGESITSNDINDIGDYPVFGGNGLRGFTKSFTHCGNYVLIGRQGALCGNINYASGQFWASEHAVVVSPKEPCDERWLGASLQAMNLNQYSLSAAQPGLSVESISQLKIAVPPKVVQDAIAAYLDRETAGIDLLIKEKEGMLALLEEKRAALISHFVTRGLNPRAAMKESGYQWLGKIPKHWKTERSKRLLIERDERSVTGTEEMLTVSHLTGVTKRSEKDVNMFEAESNEGYKLCSPDNLAINTLWAWMGAMGVSKDEGIVSPAYHVYRISGDYLPPYVDALVRTPAFVAEITRFSKGVWSSRLRLYPEGLYEVRLPVPPRDEQQAIVDAIAQEREKSAGIEFALKESIALLKERRAALITAAVTGQIPLNRMKP